jgi:cation transport regulator ChaB
MTVRIEEIAKADKNAKDLPDEAKALWVDTYNADFGQRASEAHAMKAAWRALRAAYEETEDGSWKKR